MKTRRPAKRAAAAPKAAVPPAVRAKLEAQQDALELQNEQLREAQDELETSRHRYAELYDLAPVGYCAWDASGCVQEINLAGADLFGHTRAHLTGKPFLLCVAKADRPRFLKHLWQCRRSVSKTTAEVRVAGPGAEVRWVQLVTTRLELAQQRQAGFLTAIVDITERKVAEERLVASERRFRAMTEKAVEDIILLNAEGRIIYESPHETPLLGYTPGEMTGYSGFDLIHPADTPMARRKFAEIIGRPEAATRGELRMRRKDGGWNWIFFHATNLLHEPAVGAVVLNLHNITERKEADEALRQGAQLRQVILDTLPAHLAVLDGQGVIIAVNESWSRFARESGARAGAGLSAGADYLAVCRAATAAGDLTAQQALNGIQAVMQRRQPAFGLEYQCSSPRQERWFWMQVQHLPRTENGVIISHSDITERKLAERVLRRSHDDLEARVAARTAELARANQQLTDEIAERAHAEQALRRQAALLNMSSDAIFIRDFDGRIQYWNQGAERLYGHRPEEAMGQISYELLKTVFPHGLERFQSELLKAGTWMAVVTQTTKSGQKVFVETHKQLVEQPDGTRLVLETNHDLTERIRLHEEIVAIGERERERVGQNLHDGLCQLLTAARLKNDSLLRRLNDDSVCAPDVKVTARLLSQAVDEARSLARGLEPVAELPEGLMVALQHLADSTKRLFGITCPCLIPEPVRVTDHRVASELFRIAQEAANNAIKHSHAKTIRLRLVQESENLVLEVDCDGKPFPKRPQATGLGLRTMRYRAQRIHAALEIHPGNRGGTVVRCVVSATVLNPPPAQPVAPFPDRKPARSARSNPNQRKAR